MATHGLFNNRQHIFGAPEDIDNINRLRDRGKIQDNMVAHGSLYDQD